MSDSDVGLREEIHFTMFLSVSLCMYIYIFDLAFSSNSHKVPGVETIKYLPHPLVGTSLDMFHA